MIIIKIELHSTVTKQVTLLGKMILTNDGSGSSTLGNYDGAIKRKPDFKLDTRTGRVERHPRLTKTIWHLVGAMLKNMGYTS